jgi:hypothetical protein
MGYGSFWDGAVGFFAPLAPVFKGMASFDPLISIVILGVIAFVLIRGHSRYELVRMETEALIRRYMIFRGKRHSTLHKVRSPKGTKDTIRKSISRSWHTFKEYHTHKRETLAKNYRWMKKGFILGCILLVLNTAREVIAGLLVTVPPAGLFGGLLQSLPLYLIVIVGIALLRIQKEEVYSALSPQSDPTVRALFADFDQEDPLLAEEFEPLEEEGEDEPLIPRQG